MPFIKEPPHTHGSIPKSAIVLVNLGTPDAPTRGAVRRYLKEFLSDPRVVEIPRAVWTLILHLAILPFRSGKSAAKRGAQVGAGQMSRASRCWASEGVNGMSGSCSREEGGGCWRSAALAWTQSPTRKA